jgi:hypoxanthine phosphoribosyltransferase
MKILFNQSQLQAAVNKIAAEIYRKHYNDPSPPVMICVLNGAFMFFTDLVKAINIDCEIDFIQAKSYQGQEQFTVKITKDITTNIEGKNIYVIDDILDSGNTLTKLIDHLGKYHKPRSITPIVLFKKSTNPWPLSYGIELTDEAWIYGYGLDGENGLYRNRSVVFGKSEEID